MLNLELLTFFNDHLFFWILVIDFLIFFPPLGGAKVAAIFSVTFFIVLAGTRLFDHSLNTSIELSHYARCLVEASRLQRRELANVVAFTLFPLCGRLPFPTLKQVQLQVSIKVMTIFDEMFRRSSIIHLSIEKFSFLKSHRRRSVTVQSAS